MTYNKMNEPGVKGGRPINIVGIFSIGPNPAACLVQNGRLVAMAEEERFLRLKDIELALPDNALLYCLRQGGIDFKDVDFIAYAWDATLYRGPIILANLRRWLGHNRLSDIRLTPWDERNYKLLTNIAELVFHHPAAVRQRLRLRWPGLPLPPVYFVPHHLAHAASAFYGSGFEQAAILTMDRNGEDKCTVLWSGEGSDIVRLREYRLPHSLGWFYGAFTDYLGFKPEYHEGKVMGLSAYGRPDEDIARKMQQVMPLDAKHTYALDPKYVFYGPNGGRAFSQHLVALFGPPYCGDRNDFPQPYKDIAYGLQDHLEATILSLVRQITTLTKLRSLCISGGVGLNCVANGRVAQSGLVDRVYVPPVANDAGSALGAALWVARKMGFDPRNALDHPYWGPGYSDDDICRELDKMGLRYDRYDAIEEVVARAILANGRAVAWFQDRMEIGPRDWGRGLY